MLSIKDLPGREKARLKKLAGRKNPDPVAKAMTLSGTCRPRIERDRTKYTRRVKHRSRYDDAGASPSSFLIQKPKPKQTP